MTPPKHASDPTHVTLLFEGPLGVRSVEEKIPTFREEGDDISEVSSTGNFVIEKDLQNFKPFYKFIEEIHLPCP